MHQQISGGTSTYGTMMTPPPSMRIKKSGRMLSLTNMIRQHSQRKVFNPFLYQTPKLTAYESIKILVMCILLVPLIRIVLAIAVGIPILLLAFLGTVGHKRHDENGNERPLSKWRRAIVYPIRGLLRLLLFIFGFYWIKVKYPERKRDMTKTHLIICNHISFIDGIFMAAHCFPSVAIRSDMADIPLVGNVIRALDPVLIERKTAAGRKKAFNDIRNHMIDENFPPLLIFPEGTTSSQDYLTKFKRGAFVAGLPVQPVILQYPYKHFDISWPPSVSAAYLLFRMLCQVYMSMEVRYLEPYSPSVDEQASPDMYAENVRQYMALAMGAKCTNHTFEDVRLLCQVGEYAEKHVVNHTTMGEIYHLTQMSVDEIEGLVKRFAVTDKNGDGQISLEELQALFDEDPDFVKRLFDLLDQDDNGSIDFRELCLGLSTLNAEPNTPDLNVANLSRFAFKLYDADGNGKLSRMEISHMLKLTRTLSGLPDNSVDEIVKTFDTDGDGHISLDEFERMTKENPEILDDVVNRLATLQTLAPEKNDKNVDPAENC
ncbi:lysophosphatidylcholine acyltransferase [Thraustotheca clavata]|uniref:Lysophosphatidylcholine acyltransferase n=1 Tax=Thraustotheca clavata TaxID=74557 RepID=A0A1W0A6U3_9STRA|nr:lysophosphatidylcholine acyltransferase [Thraustotheca clavata]